MKNYKEILEYLNNLSNFETVDGIRIYKSLFKNGQDVLLTPVNTIWIGLFSEKVKNKEKIQSIKIEEKIFILHNDDGQAWYSPDQSLYFLNGKTATESEINKILLKKKVKHLD